jgi:hypothetical protein
MNLSISEISKLESIYAVNFPDTYKKMLALIGEKIVKISLDRKTLFKIDRNIHKYKKAMSFVCDIQDNMMDTINEIEVQSKDLNLFCYRSISINAIAIHWLDRIFEVERSNIDIDRLNQSMLVMLSH